MRLFTFFSLLLLPVVASAVTVEGLTYPDTTTIEGKTLKLLGAGLREKWFVDVYVLAAYSESGACDSKAIVDADEAKYMRLDFLRNVPADKMRSTIGEGFDTHMPKDAPAELVAQRRQFEGYFKDELIKGSELEFLYTPGVGLTLKQKGKVLGPAITGKQFHSVLWDIYFGAETCCKDVKKAVLSTCKR